MALSARRSVRFMSASVACLSLLLSGCVTTQSQRIGADDGTDACRQYLVALDATGDYFAADIVGGALIGAAAGALIGGLASGNAKGALIGAAGGAAVGAAGGYMKAKMQQNQDKKALYGSVMSDYEKELAKIDEADLAFKKLVECRNTTLRQVAADYRNKIISRDEAKIRWKHVLDQKAHDLQIAEAMGKNMNDHLAEFENASQQMSQTPWDAEQEAALKREQQLLAQKQAQEAQALQARYDAQQAQLAKENKARAEREQAEKDMKAAHAKEVAQMKAKNAQEEKDLAQKKAGKIPTSTAQTHIQSYTANVAAVQKDYTKQQAVADNPDGFDTALAPGKASSLPESGIIRLGAIAPQGSRAA